MSDPELVRAFVRDGMVKYTAALEAVEFFEQQILNAIYATFAEATPKNFRRKQLDGQPCTPTRNPQGRGGPSRGVSAFVEGDRAQAYLALTLGVFWNPPKLPTQPFVLYGHVWQGKGVAPLEDRPAERDPRVMLGALSAKEKRMWLVPAVEFDLRTDFALLFDAVDAAYLPVA